ncbi:ZrgA family zinc uptake protein [Thalassotalea eurytherma]|uniref:DUF2796 domain-containing protein n=1 Tax=Thalassotalea eurytherma TaxID=1144278 RepID=A0ABQ6H6N1_9GAMM|nr:DUF2796 domain-containing protein [Thalassotalea eurytherma]GLX82405.1 hypothetical protein theurythT_18570 [Thalassotalea eurytherma]
MKFYLILFYLLFISIICPLSHASDFTAHIHGEAELMIAIDKNVVEIELIAPAASILGFEHQATTEQEIKRVNEAKKLLKRQANIIQFSESTCESHHAEIDTGELLVNGHHHHEKNSHEHSHSISHFEIAVHMAMECQRGEALGAVSIKLFQHFAGLERIRLLWATSTEQGSVILTPQNSEISF